MASKIPAAEKVKFQASAREANTFYPTPDAKQVVTESTYEAVKKFSAVLLEYLESFRADCKMMRGKDFELRVQRDQRWAISDLDLAVDPATGDVVETVGDGHAFFGLSQGLTSQAIRASGAMLTRQLLTNHIKPFQVTPNGTKDDDGIMVDIITSVLQDLLYRGDFETKMRQFLAEIPKHQCALLRYRMAGDAEVVFNPMIEDFEESPVELHPELTVWPILQCYVSNPNEEEPERQEAVFFISCVTLLDLQRNEVVEGEERGGRFLNLEGLQQIVEESRPASNSSYDRASLFPQMALVEFEGRLPFSRFVRDGLFTPEVAEFFNIPLPKSEKAADMIAWGRLLERVPFWWVSYVSSTAMMDLSDGGGASGVADHLLQCEPARGEKCHNSLFTARFHRDGTKFYGRSLADISHRLEKIGDRLLNSFCHISDFNANPPKFINTTSLMGVTTEDVIRRLNTPGAVIPLKPSVSQGWSIDNCVKFAKLPDPVGLVDAIQMIRGMFEAQSGVTALNKGTFGQTDTGTLGELEIMQSQAALETDERILSYAQMVSKLMVRILEDFFFYMGTGDKMVQYLENLTGLPASDIMAALPTLHPVSQEYRIEHPVQAQQNMAVKTTLLMKIFEMYGPAMVDPMEAATLLIEAAGMPRLARQLRRSQSLMTPEDEHRQMKVGNYVSPKPQEDVMLHMAMHQMEYERTQTVLATGVPGTPEHTEAVLEDPQLFQHIQETQVIAQVAALVQQQQAAQQVPPGGNPGGPNAEGDQPKVAPEGDQPANNVQMMTNISNEATGAGGENNAQPMAV